VGADHADQALAFEIDGEDEVAAERSAGARDHNPAFGGRLDVRQRRPREIAADAWVVAEAGDARGVAHAQAPQLQSFGFDHVTHRELLKALRNAWGKENGAP
jgi:hypothetical protein